MRASDHTHSPTPEDIMEYLDGEGTPAVRDHIAAHLAGCAECQAAAAEQRRISEHARAWSVPPVPDSLRTPGDLLGGRTIPRPFFRRPGRWILAGLSTAAVLLLAVPFSTPRRGAAPVIARMQGGPEIDSVTRRSSADAAGAPVRVAGNLQTHAISESVQAKDRTQVSGETPTSQAARTPSIIRTARLQIVVKEFSNARASVESLVTRAAGFIDHMTVTGDTSTARTLRGTLRVPGDRLADTLAQLRAMGQVMEDTQGSQDVTDQIIDLDARLASARATEQRLTELLRNRTGRLSDVLEVERELTRVRLDIERLDAEKTNLGRRVSYATVDVTISEERKASLDGPLSLATRVRVAAADGVETVLATLIAVILFALRAGPTLLFWAAIGAVGWLALRRRLRLTSPNR